MLNTCSIREKAEAKIYSRLGTLRKRKDLPGEAAGLGTPAFIGKVGDTLGNGFVQSSRTVAKLIHPLKRL